MQKVILAYSGGLDTSVILKWLMEKGYEVIAYIADVGQAEDFEAAREKALKIGASAVYVEDLKKEFLSDYVFKAIQGGAIYEGRYLLGTSLARPVIAKRQIEIANRENAEFVSHGATGKGNDQVRFELGYYALRPDIKVIAPWKMPEFLQQFQGRGDLLAYAEKHGIAVEVTKKAPYSMDANLLHISYEAGVLEDPAKKPAADMFRMTVAPQDAPDETQELSVHFKQGIPQKVIDRKANKTYADPVSMFEFLNKSAGKHGVGRIDIVENRFVGIKSRGVYETPAGTVLWKAHQDLETIAVDREVYRLKEALALKFAELIYNGFWFSPEMEFLIHAMEKAEENVTGVVHLELYKGNVTVVGREAENSLYDAELSSMDVEGGYDQKDAEGFIRINAVRLGAYHNLLQRK